MSSNICVHESCTGCAACASACPTDCIRMEQDAEGFLRPIIESSECIYCDKCKKVCPSNAMFPDDGKVPECYAARILDDRVRAASSSGGVFTAFAEAILAKGGIVIAAAVDDDMRVRHRVCSDPKDISNLRGSKYVQSVIGESYKDAKKALKSGFPCLFCGTPCQVGGLRSFLGKDYNNLYMVDFICHGVPSPLAWDSYLASRRAEADSDVTHVSFRSKESGWRRYSMSIEFEDGSRYLRDVTRDTFLHSFLMDVTLRPSCYSCQFRQTHRQSDATLGDFWGVDEIMPEWNDDRGMSVVLIHSQKGQALFDTCSEQLECRKLDFSEAVLGNPSYSGQGSEPAIRESFMREMSASPYDEVHDKYCGSSLTSKLRRKLLGSRKQVHNLFPEWPQSRWR